MTRTVKHDQRSLILPGLDRRLSREEVVEQAAAALRAVARVDGSTIVLVCGHSIQPRSPSADALVHRCLGCLAEGRE